MQSEEENLWILFVLLMKPKQMDQDMNSITQAPLSLSNVIMLCGMHLNIQGWDCSVSPSVPSPGRELHSYETGNGQHDL